MQKDGEGEKQEEAGKHGAVKIGADLPACLVKYQQEIRRENRRMIRNRKI